MDIKYASQIKPSERQLKWQELEFYGFIHFGMNTIINVEWGKGNDNLKSFNPQSLDTDQWVEVLKSSGMTGVILTVKHHDGFCLWPSKYTDYSVSSTPWKNGKGDIVKEVSQSCQKYDMKFGIYLSPWDRTEETYGQGKPYDDYFVNQLKELLTDYGPIFTVWLDGANGEGPNGKVQQYDWKRYYKTIRTLQSNTVISISGPDVRWVGNEVGKTRSDEWSVVPETLKDPYAIAEHSQKEDSKELKKTHKTSDIDLGSREALKNYSGKLIWYPAEVDVSIRPGWFYHPNEDESVRSSQELFSIYKKSVGRNTTLLLNVPPMPSGKIHQKDIITLKKLGEKIKRLYKNNLIVEGNIKFSSNPGNLVLSDLAILDLESKYWKASTEDPNPWIQITWDEPQIANTLILGENISEGQLIDQIKVKIKTDHNEWKNISEFHSVGYRRIIEFEMQKIIELKIEITNSRTHPNIHNILLALMEE